MDVTQKRAEQDAGKQRHLAPALPHSRGGQDDEPLDTVARHAVDHIPRPDGEGRPVT